MMFGQTFRAVEDRAVSDAVLDAWLSGTLREAYAHVEEEPVPDSLLLLLRPAADQEH